MKKLIVLAVLAAIGYFAYVRFVAPPRTADEREYLRIAKAFDGAIGRYGQANRMTSVSGMDVTADIGDIAETVDALKKELAVLEARITDEKLGAKVRDLGMRMERFLSDKR